MRSFIAPALLGLLLLLAAGCGGNINFPIRTPSYPRPEPAEITRLEIWPDNPIRGSIVEVQVDVREPQGIRAQYVSEFDGPKVRYRVSGGQLDYHERVYDRSSQSWRDIDIYGNSCLGPTDDFTWTLPQEPGRYTLTVEYWSVRRSITVCIE